MSKKIETITSSIKRGLELQNNIKKYEENEELVSMKEELQAIKTGLKNYMTEVGVKSINLSDDNGRAVLVVQNRKGAIDEAKICKKLNILSLDKFRKAGSETSYARLVGLSDEEDLT